jgi:hypothetical protein
MPKRIQLSRRKGWRKPAEAVVVARPTMWGNPFHVIKPDPKTPHDVLMLDAMHGVCYTREAAVNRYRRWLNRTREGRFVKMAARRVLRGKDLACWCPLGAPCHADVLLEIANR